VRTAFPPALLLGKNIRVWVELTSVDVALGGSPGVRPIIRGVTAGVDAGDLVVVVGPNGAGKTTLVRAIAGLVEVSAGSVRCFGRDPSAPERRTLAKELAYLPQQYELAFPFVVEEVVLLGRYARQRGLGLASAEDLAAAERAMAATDVTALRARRFDELSGGEARRVILAQARCARARAACSSTSRPPGSIPRTHAACSRCCAPIPKLAPRRSSSPTISISRCATAARCG
jgi:ABC-type cobalamin/Fe3+-siderophores transport system ATPase subunit